MNENELVVYCRFGKDYIPNLAKQHQSLMTSLSVSQPMRQIATYLINIKKLIRDHNIESETKDFSKLKTTGGASTATTSAKYANKKKSDLPPLPYYVPHSPQDVTLVFDSRFETGNLLAAMKVSDSEYDLILQNDINTNGHTQWFFFRVGNTRKDH